MKFGALRDGSGCYAAQYNKEKKRVQIIDTDPDLFTLMERQGVVSNDDDDDDDDDNEDIFFDIFPASGCQ